jgi:hypothetical protein
MAVGWWASVATKRGPGPNQGGPMRECRGVVLHVAQGTFEGTVAWCLNPASDVSAHFVSAKNGRAAQVVDTDLTAWTQSAGNGSWISIEFEGYAGDSLTSEQVEFAAQVLAQTHRAHPLVPLQLADSPDGRGLGWHGMGGAPWGGHTGCPGAPIVAQRPAILARARQIINEGDSSVFTPQQEASIVQTSEYINAWMGGRGATWDGKPIVPAAVAAQTSGDVAAIKARPAVDLTPAQMETLASRVTAILEAQISSVVKSAVRDLIVGGLGE